MATNRVVRMYSQPSSYEPARWQEDAACAAAPERDKAIFVGIPLRADAMSVKQRYCDRCPVMTQCLKWAQEDQHFNGIAGGMAFSPRHNTYNGRNIIPVSKIRNRRED